MTSRTSRFCTARTSLCCMCHLQGILEAGKSQLEDTHPLRMVGEVTGDDLLAVTALARDSVDTCGSHYVMVPHASAADL